MILIITNKEDVHPTPVIDILTGRGVPFFRLNTEALLTDYEFCWWNDEWGMDFWIRCKQNGLETRGSEITAVWERRPEKPEELPVSNTPEVDKHNRAEALGFLVFLRYYIKDIPSIGSIEHERAAESKMLQLKVARECGFSVPDTCFSNRKEDIMRFAKDYRWVILKSIESNSVWDEANDREYVFYAQRVASTRLEEFPEEAFSQTVSFVQEYVPKAFELRVTVVGDQVFACKIDSQALPDDKGAVDWRQGYDYGLKQEAYTLPEEYGKRCVAYLRKLGLSFGCFDFIVLPEDESDTLDVALDERYVFLECNPNGQWLWVELATGLPIAAAIADFLTNYELWGRTEGGAVEWVKRKFEKEVWDKLSYEFTWDEELLERNKSRVNWHWVSQNRVIVWTTSMLERFKDNIDWHELSKRGSIRLFTVEHLEVFKEYWDWAKLSCNANLPWSETLLERYADKWDWEKIIDNAELENLFSMEFFERYQEYIPLGCLRYSKLGKKLIQEIEGQFIRQLEDKCL